MTEEEWIKFKDWCKSRYRMWSPDRETIELYQEWMEREKNSIRHRRSSLRV